MTSDPFFSGSYQLRRLGHYIYDSASPRYGMYFDLPAGETMATVADQYMMRHVLWDDRDKIAIVIKDTRSGDTIRRYTYDYDYHPVDHNDTCAVYGRMPA